MSNVLPDLIAPDLRIVFTGTAVGSASARAGAYYAGPPRMTGLIMGFAGTPAALAADTARRLEAALRGGNGK